MRKIILNNEEINTAKYLMSYLWIPQNRLSYDSFCYDGSRIHFEYDQVKELYIFECYASTEVMEDIYSILSEG